MKRWTSPRIAALVVLTGALLPSSVQAQGAVSAKLEVLRGRARTSEQRGRLDVAAHDWAQVLLLDPIDAEALAGLVRAARAGGRTTEAEYYLARLRASQPKSPELAGLEAGGTGRGEPGDQAAELAEAARLAQTGDPRGAMVLYRRVYGTNPPPGPEALRYFEVEADTEEGRSHAIAGLRALADRYPAEQRYAIALGHVLLMNPRTQAEGRTLLERYPGATAAIVQGTSPTPRTTNPRAPQATPGERGARPGSRGELPADETAAFAALDEHRPDEAEARFRAILAKAPGDARALAGLGYVSVLADDFKTALNYFVQAQENGDHSLALTRALVNTQISLSLEVANALRVKGDIADAEAQYRAVLRERPADPDALEGLGTTLLQAGQFEEAIPVYTRLADVRPLSPSAWRGLVMAQTGAGRSGEALLSEAHEPAPVREPLSHDPIYLQALSNAKEARGGSSLAQAQAAQAANAAAADAAQRTPPSRVVALPPAPAQTSAEAIAAAEAEQGQREFGRGENARAAASFRQAIVRQPARAGAWRGLVLALYASGNETEALAAADAAPGPVRMQLESDATFQAAVGAVSLKGSRPNEALHAFVRAQNVFVAQRLPPPLNLLLGIAALLGARDDDGNLYRELVYLGGRTDLNERQRRDVQGIWAGWAVRRARALAAAGEQTRAVVLLNAAAGAFPGNAEVVSAVADGYAGVGLPREATALYKAQDLSRSSQIELERVIRAGLAAHDWKAAEGWVRLGLERFPGEPAMLTLAAELEQARGHEARALELSAQAKALAPAQDPQRVLAAELREARAGVGWQRGETGQLTTLLAPAEALSLATGNGATQSFLPTGADLPATKNQEDRTPVLAGYDEPSR